MIEFFGPVLGVMPAKNLQEAIDLVHQTGYGLTAGLESLDRREQDYFKANMRAGNLYINRGTTGAITLRQPFGGMGKSALGAGIKAGGPRYVAQFMDFKDAGLPAYGVLHGAHPLLQLVQDWENKCNWNQLTEYAEDIKKTVRAVKSCLYHWTQDFAHTQDYFHLRGQDNLLRYLPVGKIVVRVHPQDTLFDILTRCAAAQIAGCDVAVSIPPALDNAAVAFIRDKEGQRLLGDTPLSVDTEDALIQMLPDIDRIRYAGPDRIPEALWSAAAATGFYIARTPVSMHGIVELIHYLREQSICDNYHRYGNLGERSL
jgi:RHH-type proline utilization regulon transcriptional repressor/proline dehydrogenase/delta 1-pyrroline-5-carboxylate dehydrogenase